jgi:hypothetical protein
MGKIDNLITKYNYVTLVLQTMCLIWYKEMELRLKYIEMLEKWGFRMSKINTIDGDSVRVNKDSTRKR